jgi:hypothetical protein
MGEQDDSVRTNNLRTINNHMTNTIEESKQLPDIDEQIRYIKHLRKSIMNNLQTGIDMIMAIEQSLLAAKLFGKSKGIDFPASREINRSSDPQPPDVTLESVGIKRTPLRIEILRAISSKHKVFTLTEIFNLVSKNVAISKTSLIETLILFRNNGLVEEIKAGDDGAKKIGRPQIRYRYKFTN